MLLICGLLFSLSPLYVNAALRTVIVDDQSGDQLTGVPVTFLPSEAGFSQGPLCRDCPDSWCQGCALSPDPSKAHGGTWRVANHAKGDDTPKYLQFDFVGTAVAIYCIVPNLPSSSNLTTQYALEFEIDGRSPPSGQKVYIHVSDGSGAFAYNVPVFNETGLRNERHTMMVSINPVPDIDAVLLFDYATYIFDDVIFAPVTPLSSSANSSRGSTTSSTNSRIPTDLSSTVSSASTPAQRQNDDFPVTGNQRKHLIVILGSSIGSFVTLSALVVLLFCYLRRRRVSTGPRTSQTIHPFTTRSPRMTKNRLKDLSTESTENIASGSGAHLQESDEGEREGVNSVDSDSDSDSDSEDPPPEYSSRPDSGFPL
ncbi:hypothetical protein PQX77_013803 [Marasmius sp. AFHP31]|nr:hypothetical protein PQX77_013803 [Marasmius sp. AFHP31]